MYLNFKDLLLIILKSLILTLIVIGLMLLGVLDYHLGIGYCSIMNIPQDFAITVFSPGMAIEVCIILYVVELVGFYFIIKLFRRFNMFNNFYEFLDFDY